MKGNHSYNSKDAIKGFNESLDNIKRTEYIFYLNELKNLEVIKDIGGIFKIGERPVGADYDSIINYYDQNQELFLEHKKQVLESMKGTAME